jgi:hypothetical protein
LIVCPSFVRGTDEHGTAVDVITPVWTGLADQLRLRALVSAESGPLVGNGPAFVNYEAAFSAFFLAAAPGNQANQEPLWRVLTLDLRAWLHQVRIAADGLTVVVKGRGPP